MNQDVKTCSLCHDAKPTAEFYVRPSGALYAHCKACHAAMCKCPHTPYADLSPEEKVRKHEAVRRWRETHPEKVRQFWSDDYRRMRSDPDRWSARLQGDRERYRKRMADPEQRRRHAEKQRAYMERKRARAAES